MAKIIDGLATREKILGYIQEEIERNKFTPKLAVILVGEDKASRVYVKNKVKTCKKIGISSETILLSEDISEEVLLSKIDALNKDKETNGILVQLPLPRHIREERILESISKEKDVDCFHPTNVGNLSHGKGTFKPCTPFGIIMLLKDHEVEIKGKNLCIIGRSNIVGKPMMHMALQEDATVTICHSKTENLKSIAKQADILIVAIGRGNFVTKDFVKEGAVVIDVGMHRTDEGKLFGDVNFEEVEQVASMITPVPGGVGPMTIASLMLNCLNAYKIQNNKNEVK